MRRIVIILMALMIAVPQFAQTMHRSTRGTRHTTTTVRKGTTKTKKQSVTNQSGGKSSSGKKTGKPNYTTKEIRGLQNQRSKVQQEIKTQQGKLNANKADVQNGYKIWRKSMVRLTINSAISMALRRRLPA